MMRLCVAIFCIATATAVTEKSIERLETIVHNLANKFETISKENQQLREEHAKLKLALEKKENQMAPGDVAFAAELSSNIGPNAEDEVVPYSRVFVERGSGYDRSSYTFTASARGLYYFSWSTMTASGGHACSYLARNGRPEPGFAGVGNFGPAGEFAFGSQAALLVVESGDAINIRLGDHSECQAVYATELRVLRSCHFSGFLVKNM